MALVVDPYEPESVAFETSPMNLSSVMDIPVLDVVVDADVDFDVDVDLDLDPLRLILDSDLRRCNSMTVSILRIMER